LFQTFGILVIDLSKQMIFQRPNQNEPREAERKDKPKEGSRYLGGEILRKSQRLLPESEFPLPSFRIEDFNPKSMENGGIVGKVYIF